MPIDLFTGSFWGQKGKKLYGGKLRERVGELKTTELWWSSDQNAVLGANSAFPEPAVRS